MKKISRRDLLVSLACSSIFLSTPSLASVCDVSRAKRNNVSTKSYECRFGNDGKLTTTFMRVTDLLFDSAGDMGLPANLGDYESLLDGHQLIETPLLSTLRHLLQNYSFAVEPFGVTLEFDGRAEGQNVQARGVINHTARWRTLGVWDDPDSLPLFPLPDELRRAMRGDNTWNQSFLRYANDDDFNSLDDKIDAYIKLWGSKPEETVDKTSLGNLELLRHIEAGSVDEFLPLIFSDHFGFDGCTGEPEGGAHYNPPALYIDVAVSRNDGREPVVIEDYFGVVEKQENLRSYNSSTPGGAERFGLNSIQLDPGKSVMLVQRLLFGALPYERSDMGLKVRSNRAVFGETNLPKGVVINSENIAFDGRSHNSVIIASYGARGSCPYLHSWCDMSQEWVTLGKVLTECVGEENSGQDSRRFFSLRTRFKLVEREHEETILHSICLKLTLDDHSTIMVPHNLKRSTLNIGESYEFSFDLPQGVSADDIGASELLISGFYTKYGERKLQERREALNIVPQPA